MCFLLFFIFIFLHVALDGHSGTYFPLNVFVFMCSLLFGSWVTAVNHSGDGAKPSSV